MLDPSHSPQQRGRQLGDSGLTIRRLKLDVRQHVPTGKRDFSTIGRDLFARAPAWLRREPAATRVGLLLAGAAALALALLSRSVVELWHALGTVGTCTLLLPVLGAFVPRLRPSPRGATWMMALALPISLGWLLSMQVLADGEYLLGLEPIYPGLAVAAGVWCVDRLGRGRS